jgi:hypothetical protein
MTTVFILLLWVHGSQYPIGAYRDSAACEKARQALPALHTSDQSKCVEQPVQGEAHSDEHP